jgi:hypothetical protein
MAAKEIRLALLLAMWAASAGFGLTQTASAQEHAPGAMEFASRSDQSQVQQHQSPVQQKRAAKPGLSANASASVPEAGPDTAPQPKSVRSSAAKGPYYVDFRARTAATYGHAFVWYGKTSQKAVEVAGLHPAGDVLPYVLGHLMWVPSETGASYGDLDVQYLTASYRVYLNEADAKKVFAFIKDIQAHSPLWNAETYNCTAFIGRIASFMGLKTPFHLQVPEEYVNNLKRLNGNRQTAQLSVEQ